MAKTNWQMNEIVQPADLNQIGQEINELQDAVENVDIPDATLTTKGKVQLSSATNSTAEDRAATPKAVKTAADAAATAQTTANAAQTKANAALPASSYTAADILAKLKTVDGAGSGLDADLLDGRSGLEYSHAGLLTAAQLNVNTTLPAGIYVTNEASTLGLPWNWAHIINLKHVNNDGWNSQIATPLDVTAGDMYVRYSAASTWSMWKRIWTDNALRVNAGRLEFLDGGVWKGVGDELSQYKNMTVAGGENPPTLTTVASVTGKKGYLDRALIRTNNVSGAGTRVKVTIDGVVTFDALFNASSSTAYISGVTTNGQSGIRIPGTALPPAGNFLPTYVSYPYVGTDPGFCSLPNKIYFNNSLLVEVTRGTSSASNNTYEVGFATE